MQVLSYKCSDFNSYSRDYVQKNYALKQEATAASASTDEADSFISTQKVNGTPWEGTDCYYITQSGYFTDLAKDYLNGNLTDDEFYSCIEDLCYASGAKSDDLPIEERQKIFNSVMMEVNNGLIHYYGMKNADEWEALRKDGVVPDLYYNTDYHYQHLDAKEKFMAGANLLASKFGLNSADERLNGRFTTVHESMMGMLSNNAGRAADWKVIPPEGMKITFQTRTEPYEAKIQCKEGEFSTKIPFSYAMLDGEFSLAELFKTFDIPEKYMQFIRNINLINWNIAWTDPTANGVNGTDPTPWSKVIKNYETASFALS